MAMEASSDLPLLSWRPPSKVAIFPATRNRRKVLSIARIAAGTKNPENTIRAAVDRVRASHARKGLPAELVLKDVSEFESALRAELSTLLNRRGGVA